MPNVQIMPSTPIEPVARTAWVQPEVRRLNATGAEVSGAFPGVDLNFSGS